MEKLTHAFFGGLLLGSRGGFHVYEVDQDQQRTLPFYIQSGAPSLSVVVTDNGRVGLGTDSPEAQLHVLGDARMDGSLQVGQCTFDANKCQFRLSGDGRGGRFRFLKGLGGGSERDVVVDWEDDEKEGRNWRKALATIDALEARIQALESADADRQSSLLQYVQSLEAKVALLVTKENQE